MKRREFVASMALAATVCALRQNSEAATNPTATNSGIAQIPIGSSPGTLRGEMLYRKLGRTGVEVSAIGLGGSHFASPQLPEAESIRLLHQAVDRGITFMDNSWDYHDGQSEERMGKALAQGGYRNKVFLMTKIDGRTREAANAQINESLKRLQTDHIDLLQHHEVLRFDDPDRIFAEGGAMEAVLAAKQAGKIRFIGFTGHKDPHVHLYMLEVAHQHGFHFDTAQMPLNVLDAHFRSFAQLVVPRVIGEGIGLLSMKSMCGGTGIVLKSGTGVQPLECLHYALNLPTSVVIAGIDTQAILDQAFKAAKSFRPMSHQQMAAVLSKTREAALSGKYELFKTTSHFDTTAKHPDWLGSDAEPVQELAPQSAG
jgi:aryl-alcohol dehydrogenase-like predicted oxidoreductase